MTIKGLLATATAMALTTTGTMAAAQTANPAAGLSPASATRAGSPAAHGSKLGASVPTATLISIGILAALTVIVLEVAKTDNNNGGSPASP